MKIKIEIDTERNDYNKSDTEYIKDIIEKTIKESINAYNEEQQQHD